MRFFRFTSSQITNTAAASALTLATVIRTGFTFLFAAVLPASPVFADTFWLDSCTAELALALPPCSETLLSETKDSFWLSLPDTSLEDCPALSVPAASLVELSVDSSVFDSLLSDDSASDELSLSSEETSDDADSVLSGLLSDISELSKEDSSASGALELSEEAPPDDSETLLSCEEDSDAPPEDSEELSEDDSEEFEDSPEFPLSELLFSART